MFYNKVLHKHKKLNTKIQLWVFNDNVQKVYIYENIKDITTQDLMSIHNLYNIFVNFFIAVTKYPRNNLRKHVFWLTILQASVHGHLTSFKPVCVVRQTMVVGSVW